MKSILSSGNHKYSVKNKNTININSKIDNVLQKDLIKKY